MTIPSAAEVAAMFGWKDEGYNNTEVAVEADGAGYRIVAKQMYEYLPVTFAGLSALSEFSGTKAINDSRFNSNGCETCDYGSNYEITITVQPEVAA